MNSDKLTIADVEYWITDMHGRMIESFLSQDTAEAASVEGYPIIVYITMTNGLVSRAMIN